MGVTLLETHYLRNPEIDGYRFAPPILREQGEAGQIAARGDHEGRPYN